MVMLLGSELKVRFCTVHFFKFTFKSFYLFKRKNRFLKPNIILLLGAVVQFLFASILLKFEYILGGLGIFQTVKSMSIFLDDKVFVMIVVTAALPKKHNHSQMFTLVQAQLVCNQIDVTESLTNRRLAFGPYLR